MRCIVDRLASHRYIIRQEIRALVMAEKEVRDQQQQVVTEPAGAVAPPPAAAAAVEPTIPVLLAILGSGRRPGPDRKSITRMVEALERAGQLKRLALTMPASRKSVGDTKKVGSEVGDKKKVGSGVGHVCCGIALGCPPLSRWRLFRN